MNPIDQEWKKICQAIERGLDALEFRNDDITLRADIVGYETAGRRWTRVHWLQDTYWEQYAYPYGVKLASFAFSFPGNDDCFYVEWQDDLGVNATVHWEDLTEDQRRRMDAIAEQRRVDYKEGLRHVYQEKAWRALAAFYELPTEMTWLA